MSGAARGNPLPHRWRPNQIQNRIPLLPPHRVCIYKQIGTNHKQRTSDNACIHLSFHKSRSSSGRKSDHARLIWCNSTEELPPPASRRSSLLKVINFSDLFCREARWILMHPDAFCREERFDSMLSTFFIEKTRCFFSPMSGAEGVASYI